MRTFLLPLAAALVFNAGDDTRQTANRGSDGVTIQIFQFRPGLLEITTGTTVTWTNGDQIEHTITAGIPDSATGNFSGSLVTKGSMWSRTFERPGSYPYYCERHHFMRGEIRVTTTGGN